MRRAFFSCEDQRRRLIVEAAIVGGGNVVGAAQILGEALGAFEPRRRPGWPEDENVLRREVVGDAGDQRLLRPNDDETHAVLAAKFGDRAMIGHIEVDQFAAPRDARIARRDEQLSEPRAAGQGIGDGVLASTRSDQKNIHASLDAKRPRARARPRASIYFAGSEHNAGHKRAAPKTPPAQPPLSLNRSPHRR